MKFVAFDVETAGLEPTYALEPFRMRTFEAWVTMFALASEEEVTGQILPGRPSQRQAALVKHMRPLLRRIAQKGEIIAGWNVPFDMAWLIAAGLRDEVYACKWIDGMNLERHLTASPEWTQLAPKSYGLKAAVGKYLPDEAGYEAGVDFNATDPAEILRLFMYNRADADKTRRIVELQWALLTPQQQRCALVESVCLPMVAETYVEGLRASADKARDLADHLTAEVNVAYTKLCLTSGTSIPLETLASPLKLAALLYDTWGLTPPKFTPTGGRSTDREALVQLALTDPRANLVNNYREALNNRTKFAEGTIASLNHNEDGCVRPLARVYGTYTGRMTYSSKTGRGKEERPTGVPIHQWKRAAEFRDLIEVPEGYTLLEFDFSGQEYRWMAVKSGDPVMLGLCAEGEDAHAFMGANFGGVPYRRLQEVLRGEDFKVAQPDLFTQMRDFRQLGKVGNLSLQYRTSANRLVSVAKTQFQMPLTYIAAGKLHRTYRNTYKQVPVYWQRQIAFARNHGYVETVAGRRVQLGTGDTWPVQCWGYESTAINFPIQGSGADQKYLALAVAKDYLNKVGGRFYFELHDGLFVIVPSDKAERAAHELKQLLSNLPYKQAWGVDLPVQFPVDAKMGPAWGQLKEVK